MNLKSLHVRNLLAILGCLIIVVASAYCNKKGSAAPQISVSVSEVFFPADGGVKEVIVTGNTKWSLSNPATSWLQVSPTTGKDSATVQLTAVPNTAGSTRSAVLVITAENGQARRVTVSQESHIYPSYNTTPQPDDASGMSSTAVQLAAKINLGWNIGNTLEAIGGETAWGNPQINNSFIQFVKQSGFNAIRLPCSWDQYADKKTAKIQDTWLNRVKEVVQHCVDNDMYVLLNVHWDGGWLENNCTPNKKDSVNARQKAFWEQIATALRDFDEHLMFASANEPNADDATKMAVLQSYHQTFVNAVRTTGGRNRYRILVVQGSSEFLDTLPADATPNRIMYEEHCYTPFQFCGLNEDASWGKMFYYWGAGNHSAIEPGRNATWGEEEEITKYFKRMKEKYVDKGIPFLLGEYGAYRRTTPLDMEKHQASVDYWITFVTREAIAHGLKPFFWETGGVLDRRNYTVLDQRTIDAILAGAQ